MPILSSQERSHFHRRPWSCNWCTNCGNPLYTVKPLTYRISQVKSFNSYNLQCPCWRCSYSTQIERHYRQTCMCFSSYQPIYYNATFSDYIHSQYRVTYQVSRSIHYPSDNQAQWIYIIRLCKPAYSLCALATLISVRIFSPFSHSGILIKILS